MDYDPELVQRIYELSMLINQLENKMDKLENLLGIEEVDLNESEFSEQQTELARSFYENRIFLQNLKIEFNQYIKYYNLLYLEKKH